MEETTTASGSSPESEGPDDPLSNGKAHAGFDRAVFARTGTALAELGRALRDDLAAASRLAAEKLRALGSEAVSRLRDIDFQAVKIRAAETTARSAAVWSRVWLWRLRSPDQRAVGEKRSRWREFVVRVVATAGVACLVLVAVLFSWALRDVPWEEIADGSSSRWCCSKRPMASRW